MKKQNILENRIINKKNLDNYLSDFKKELRDKLILLFTEEDLGKGTTSFMVYVRKTIGMPMIGKNALNYWISRGWDKYEAEDKRTKVVMNKEKSPMNVNFWINKGLSEEESVYKIKSFRKMNKEYWIERGFTEEEAIKNSNNFQIESNKKFTELLKTDAKYLKEYRIKNNTTIEYYLNKGFTEEEAKNKLRDRQSTFSLEKCVNEHGPKYGPLIWKGRQDKWLDTLSKNRKLKIGYSSVSQDLFNLIYEKLPLDYKENLKYATRNKELCLFTGSKIYLYDFADIVNLKIIEFNGDIFHANPNKYKSDDLPNPFLKEMRASEIWEKDLAKIEFAKSKGYDVLTIWEDEYRRDISKTIDKCIFFLLKK
jgi:hypothetical protein